MMELLSRFAKKLYLLFDRKRYARDLDEEMAFHREQAEREFIAAGLSPEAARYSAMRRLGNATRVREKSHEVVGFKIETVVQDLRFALRQFRKNPGFSLTAILILGLGMGASVAIFAFVDAALIEPLPFANSSRLMAVDEKNAMWPRSNLSFDDYQDWKRMNRSFSSLDVYSGTGYMLRTPSGSEPVSAARVSDGFFSTLGVRPMLGRVFLPGEDKPGGAKIVVLSYGTWLNRFGGRMDIVGQSVNLDGANYSVVGVLPREFAFAPRGAAEVWTPLLDKSGCEQRRGCHNLDGIARLRDGVTEQAALADLTAIAEQLEVQYPGTNKGQEAMAEPLAELIVGTVRPILLMLLAGAGLLLLIACVNVASLLLVRSESRRREIAVRGALGATRLRLTRQFVTEGLLLAVGGCMVGLGFGVWVMRMLTNLVPKTLADYAPFLARVGFNSHTSAFAGGIAVLASILLAATPTVRLSFQGMRDGLAEGGRGSAGLLWRRMGASLVVVELSVAVVLLVGAGLLGQSFYRLMHVETGFAIDHMATVQMMAPQAKYKTNAQLTALYREVERRVASLPGVQSAGLTTDLPLNCNCDTDWIRIVGKPFHGEHNEVNERDVSASYLPTLGVKLVRGRLFTDAEDKGKPQVIVINEAFARKYFAGEDPVGQKVGNGDLAPDSLRQIIGVVSDVREGALDADIWPAEYQALNQQEGDNYFSVAVRTVQDEKAILPVLVSTLRSMDPNMGVYGETTMTQQMDSSQSALLHRLSSWFVGGFAFLALVLGVVGLYGVVAYSVSQRTREIGVRMALGAQRSSVYKLVLGEAGWLVGVGVALGLAGSLGAAMLMGKLLFGVQAWDAGTLIGVAVVLGSSAMLASYFPARRAASVNPTEALRAE